MTLSVNRTGQIRAEVVEDTETHICCAPEGTTVVYNSQSLWSKIYETLQIA